MSSVVSLTDKAHGFDPKAVELRQKVGPVADWPVPAGYRVMVAQYMRPEKTKGGIILTDNTRKEDVYQGNVGLVLRCGDDAYADKDRYPNGPWCQEGDWVLWSSYSTQGRRIEVPVAGSKEKVSIAFLNEDEILAKISDPEKAL